MVNILLHDHNYQGETFYYDAIAIKTVNVRGNLSSTLASPSPWSRSRYFSSAQGWMVMTMMVIWIIYIAS